MKVWVMAQIKGYTGEEHGWKWELGGIFTTKEKAIAACVDQNDCIWEDPVDVAFSRETEYMDAYFPLRHAND